MYICRKCKFFSDNLAQFSLLLRALNPGLELGYQMTCGRHTRTEHHSEACHGEIVRAESPDDYEAALAVG